VSNARAIWTYEFVMDNEGKGRFEFVEASLNGPSQISNFAPILAGYLEQHEFRLDWVPPSIGTSPRPGEVQIAGLFRTDDPASHVIGRLNSFDGGSTWPMPSSPSLHEIFSDG